jgi:hypothetical protein
MFKSKYFINETQIELFIDIYERKESALILQQTDNEIMDYHLSEPFL